MHQLAAAEEMQREQSRSREHLESQLRKAEEALKREKAQTEAELSAVAQSMEDVEARIEAARNALNGTTDATKELDPTTMSRLVEE